MSGAQRFEHAELYVNDLDGILGFWTDVVGLVEVGRANKTVYLGCGLDTNYDVAFTEGGTGSAHFAIRVDSDDELDGYATRLKEAGRQVVELTDAEPGEVRAVRFELPSGHTMEYVTVADTRYLVPSNPAFPRSRGIAPLDTDHVNLIADDLQETAEFMCDVLDFKLSEYSEPERGSGDWLMSWLRKGGWHHDVGFVRRARPADTLHHVALMLAGFEHLKVLCDTLAGVGIRVEAGPGRHPVGSNLYVYVHLPGGNRFEFCCEMAVLPEQFPTKVWTGIEETGDAWCVLADRLPTTFTQGS